MNQLFRHSTPSAILVVLAHPDDELFISQLLIALATLRRDVLIRCIYLTGVRTERELEARNSLALLDPTRRLANGAEFCSFPDTELNSYIPKIAASVSAHLEPHRPALVITHDPCDDHADHCAAFGAVSIACRYRDVSMLTFATPSTRLADFRPNFFAPMTRVELEIKLAAASAHKSQRAKPYMHPGYLTNLARGWKCWCPGLLPSEYEFHEAYRFRRIIPSPLTAELMAALASREQLTERGYE